MCFLNPESASGNRKFLLHGGLPRAARSRLSIAVKLPRVPVGTRRTIAAAGARPFALNSVSSDRSVHGEDLRAVCSVLKTASGSHLRGPNWLNISRLRATEAHLTSPTVCAGCTAVIDASELRSRADAAFGRYALGDSMRRFATSGPSDHVNTLRSQPPCRCPRRNGRSTAARPRLAQRVNAVPCTITRQVCNALEASYNAYRGEQRVSHPINRLRGQESHSRGLSNSKRGRAVVISAHFRRGFGPQVRGRLSADSQPFVPVVFTR